jgi:hypothetical protein
MLPPLIKNEPSNAPANSSSNPTPAGIPSSRLSSIPSQPGGAVVAGARCEKEGVAAEPDSKAPNGGWHKITGGWSGNGCDGSAQWTVTTGEVDFWDTTYAWKFRPGGAPTCAISVYVPDTPYAAGTAYYDFFGDSNEWKDRRGTATVDQATHRGQWVDLGTYHTPDKILQVVFANRSNRNSAVYSVAVSTARAQCR